MLSFVTEPLQKMAEESMAGFREELLSRMEKVFVRELHHFLEHMDDDEPSVPPPSPTEQPAPEPVVKTSPTGWFHSLVDPMFDAVKSMFESVVRKQLEEMNWELRLDTPEGLKMMKKLLKKRTATEAGLESPSTKKPTTDDSKFLESLLDGADEPDSPEQLGVSVPPLE